MRSRPLLKRIEYLLLIVTVAHAPQAHAQDAGQGRDGSTEIAPGVHLLSGLSCNVLAVTGPQGLFLVDNGSAANAARVSDLVEQLGAGPARIAVNTHFHFDHIGGNERLAESGATIVAQERLRSRLQSDWWLPASLGLRMPVVPPYPEMAQPIVTFEGSATVHFGGNEIALLHLPTAHTDADVAVLLRQANVLHTGDLFASGGFVPPLDSYHGGTIDGWIAAVEELISLIDDSTKVVPGHGPVADRQALREFRDVRVVGRERIAALVEGGSTLDEVLAADPMEGLAGGRTAGFVRTVYAELAWSPPLTSR